MNIKPQYIVFGVLMYWGCCLYAQPIKEFEALTLLKEVPSTSVKDQQKSSTCWSYAGISFLESEIIRKTGQSINLSEMFVVRKCYQYKAERYLRMHGYLKFTPGGALHDVLWVMENFGLVPESACDGRSDKGFIYSHNLLDNQLKDYLKKLVQSFEGQLETVWSDNVEEILDKHLGVYSDLFQYNGKNYSAQTFYDEVVQLRVSDYIQLTSFSHHPYYSSFNIEIPDNWLGGRVYNVPVADFCEIIRSAILQGYTVGVALDITEKGFNYKKGRALVEGDEVEMSDVSFQDIKTIRQHGFDTYQTTDDHGMHIVGIAKDKAGKIYYKVKNSWSDDNCYGGYLFMSEQYFLMKTIYVLLNKAVVPELLMEKLSIW